MKHLPECPSTSTDPLAEDCCCSRLHACEQRVASAFHVVRRDENSGWEKFARDQFDAGYALALDAACEAALANHKFSSTDDADYFDEDSFLAAIDALRAKP